MIRENFGIVEGRDCQQKKDKCEWEKFETWGPRLNSLQTVKMEISLTFYK